MEAPFNLESEVWKIAVGDSPQDICDYIAYNAIILIDGKRYSGEKFAESFIEFGCMTNTIDEFEVVVNEDYLYQVTYKTTVKRRKEEIINETYTVTTTWKNYQDNFFMVFAMAIKEK